MCRHEWSKRRRDEGSISIGRTGENGLITKDQRWSKINPIITRSSTDNNCFELCAV